MNRFSFGAKSVQFSRKKIGFSIFFFVGIFLFFLYATGTLSSGSIERQRESLQNALQKNVIYHYSVYGSYPSSLEEIENLYQLAYDKNSFFVDYTVRGENIMPEITVVERSKQ